MSAEMQEIGKRNNRNPGHAWQDNELYSVFRPVIGYLPAWIFAVMSRWCYGHEVRMGLREIAEEAGVSRSSAHRATLAMQALNMIRIRDGRGRAAASYELCDLKEAARALGAQRDARRGSLTLNASQVRELKKRVAAALACVPVRDAKEEAAEPACVPVRDAKDCGNPPLVSQFVSQNRGVCVPDRGGPSITQRNKDIKTKPTPNPTRKRAGRSEQVSLSPEEQNATERVCRECGVTDPRWERAIGQALRKYGVQECKPPWDVGDAMIVAWRAHKEAARWLWRVSRPDKFFKHGLWLDEDRWSWDREKLERAGAARVGMER